MAEGPGFRWGHINVNVTNLERSVAFYRKLGFEEFLPNIPYLAIDKEEEAKAIPNDAAEALGLEGGARARACILQLGADGGFPKLDLTEYAPRAGVTPAAPHVSEDLGPVRICLLSRDLEAAYRALSAEGVEFLTPPRPGDRGRVTMATCRDPDGTLIELLEIHPEKWSAD